MISSLSDRAHYNTLLECTYLNQASLGLTGQPAVAAMHTYLDTIGRHGNMCLSDDEEVALLTPLRKNAAALMHCPEEQLAIMSSAGEMLSQLPYLLSPPSGSKFISVASDFPAITRPWIAYAESQNLELEFVHEQADEDLTDSLIHHIDQQTSVVAVSYVQFSTGSRTDILRLREATQRVGAYLVVDVTQAAGAIPIDARTWNADVIVCSGYKWLGGQGGVGLAVVSPALLQKTPPAPGWMGAADPFDMQTTSLPLAGDARRFTQSTMSYIAVTGLTVAINELLSMGANHIDLHAQQLAQRLNHELQQTPWRPFRALEQQSASSHIITLANLHADVDQTLQAMRDAQIVCGNRNGRIRVSIAHFNDESDIKALVAALKDS